MKHFHIRQAAASILAGLLICMTLGSGSAESLAGKEGDRRFPPYLPGNPKDQCTSTYRAYVAASGHSAYATTPYARIRSLYIICGSRLNAPSQKAAEELALKSCQATRAHYKVITGAGCEVAVSK
jgi:hypothetical protein